MRYFLKPQILILGRLAALLIARIPSILLESPTPGNIEAYFVKFVAALLSYDMSSQSTTILLCKMTIQRFQLDLSVHVTSRTKIKVKYRLEMYIKVEGVHCENVNISFVIVNYFIKKYCAIGTLVLVLYWSMGWREIQRIYKVTGTDKM